MKQSPSDKDAGLNFEPSKFSGDGFLGSDTRLPLEIITADQAVLEDLGLSREELASSLRDAYDKGVQGLGSPVEIGPGVTAVLYESRGRIPSPFRGEGTFEKGEVVVSESGSGREIVVTALAIHLIEKHGFFQGRGSRYRIEPKTAVEILRVSS